MSDDFFKISKGLTLREQSSTPSNAVDGDVYYDSTLNKFRAYQNGAWTNLINESSGGINYITNSDAEVNTSGWVDYADPAASTPDDGTGGSPSQNLTKSTSTDLRGNGLFSLTKISSNVQGHGFSYDFTIDSADLSKQLEISYDYTADSNFEYNGGVAGDESDIMMYIYDVTNSQLITPLVSGLDGSGRFVSSFQADATSTSYRLIFHIATTNATSWVFRFDNVRVGPAQTAVIPAVQTDWVEWTPTGTWSNTTYTGFYRRVGDSIEVQINLELTGTPSGTLEVDMMPTEFSWDTSKYARAPSGEADVLFNAVLQDTGTAQYEAIGVTYTGNTTRVRVRNNTTRVTNSAPFSWVSGDTLTLTSSNPIPVTGWSSGRESAVAVDSNRPVSAIYEISASTANSSLANGVAEVIDFDTKIKDTHNAVTTGASWTFTAPVTGDYCVQAQVTLDNTTPDQETDGLLVYIRKNGSNHRLGFNSYGIVTTSHDVFTSVGNLVSLNAGETLDITAQHSAGTAENVNTLGQRTFISIFKTDSGSPLAALTEPVKVHYEISASTANSSIAVSSTEIVDYDTEIEDSHAAVTTGASWSFSAPKTATYIVSAALRSATTGVPSGVTREFTLFLYKNTVEEKRLGGDLAKQASSAIIMYTNGSTTVELAAGDTLDIRCFQNIRDATALSLNTNGNIGYVTITSID